MKRYSYKSIVILALLVLTLKSCFLAKEYEQPKEFEPNESLFRTDNIQKDSTSIAEISWRDFFLDESLQKHIEEGLENSIDIRIALNQILIANAYAKEAKAGFFPEINFDGGVNYQNLASNSQFGGFFNLITQYEADVNLSWEADIWGKIKSGQRAQQAAQLQSIAAHQAVKTDLVANIATTYFEITALDKQISITEKTIATRQESYETAKALKSSGQLTEVGVQQTKAQVHAAEAILIDLKNELRLAENRLSILKAIYPTQPERNSLDEIELASGTSEGYPIQLLQNRPDVREAEQAFVNAFQLENVARANLYPSLILNSSAGLQSLKFSDFISPNSFFYNAFGGVTQPIFNRRRLKTEREVAEIMKLQQALTFQQKVLQAGQEVSDALYQVDMFGLKIEAKDKEFSAYEHAYEGAKELLINGIADYLEVLNAQENVLQTELDLVQAKRDLFTSKVNLYRALGGGWQ